jgi:hypothetical protein
MFKASNLINSKWIERMRRGEKIRVQLPAVASIRVLKISASLFIVTGKRKEKPIFIGSGQVFCYGPVRGCFLHHCFS